MDVRDSPWRPPRERQSEGGGRGKVLRRTGEQRALALALVALRALAGPLAEPRRPTPGRDRSPNPPGSPHGPHTHFHVPRL